YRPCPRSCVPGRTAPRRRCCRWSGTRRQAQSRRWASRKQPASAEQLVENQRATGSRGGGVQVLREKVIADLLGDVSGDTGRFVEHLLNSDSAVRVLVNSPRELGGKELLCFSHTLRSMSSSQQRRRNRCWRRRLRYQRR